MYKILILHWWKEKVKSSRWRSQFTNWFPTIEDELVSMFSGILFTRYKCLSRICCIIILLCFVLFSDHIIISNDSVQPSSSVEFDDSAIINSSKVVYSSSSIITSTFYPSLNINETTAQQNQSDLQSKCTRNQEFENRYSPYTIPWSTIKHLYVNFKLQVLRHDRKKKESAALNCSWVHKWLPELIQFNFSGYQLWSPLEKKYFEKWNYHIRSWCKSPRRKRLLASNL